MDPVTPYCDREGAIARIAIFLGLVPLMIKPPISTLSPVPTIIRVETLAKLFGDGDGNGFERVG